MVVDDNVNEEGKRSETMTRARLVTPILHFDPNKRKKKSREMLGINGFPPVFSRNFRCRGWTWQFHE